MSIDGRQKISSGSPWEPRVGFSRAVRHGRNVFFSGTLDTDPNGVPVGKDAYEQAANIFARFTAILESLGGSASDVVRTRMYLLSAEDADAVSRAHAEVFRDVLPAATMVVVAGFVGEGFRVEIEADAILEG